MTPTQIMQRLNRLIHEFDLEQYDHLFFELTELRDEIQRDEYLNPKPHVGAPTSREKGDTP